MARYYFLPGYLRKIVPLSRNVIWRAEACMVGLFLGGLRLLPLPAAMRVGGGLFAVLGPHSRRADKVRANLTLAFADKSPAQIERLTRASFRHLGVAMGELARMDKIWREHDKRLEFVVGPGAQTPSPGRVTVFVTAHCGAWQLTTLVGPYYGVTIPVIYAPEENPYVDRKLAALRRAFGSPLVSRDGGIRVLMRALDKGQSIGMTLDTRMDAGEALPFFGHDAFTNTAAARLALRYGCDLVPARAERLPGARYRISLCTPIRPRDPDADVAAQARDMTRQVNNLFEDWIRDEPGEWLCLKRRWPKVAYKQAEQA